MATLITISGLAGAGKDTTAVKIRGALTNEGMNTVILSIQDFPKKAISDLLKIPVENLFNDPDTKNVISDYLNNYTQMMKMFAGDSYWAYMLLEKMKYLKDVDYFIVPDLKYQEELLVMNEFKGKMYNTAVYRDDVLPADPDWLIAGYNKGLLEGNQFYQFRNISSTANPLAYMEKSSFDAVFENNAPVPYWRSINQFVQIKLLQNGKSVPRVSQQA